MNRPDKQMIDRLAFKRVLTAHFALIIAIVGVLAGVGLIYLSEQLAHCEMLIAAALFREVGAVLLAAALLHLAWDIFLKRRFLEELWSYARLSSEVSDSGLKSF